MAESERAAPSAKPEVAAAASDVGPGFRNDLRLALHRVVDAAIESDDALREEGTGHRLDKAVAVLARNTVRAVSLYRQAKAGSSEERHEA